VVLESLEASKGSSTGYQLVAQGSLVLVTTVVVVELLISIVRFTYRVISGDKANDEERRTYPSRT